MAETHSTPVAEPIRQSSAHAPVAIQRQPQSPQALGMGPIQRATNAISGGSPLTSPNAFGSMIENLPDSASRASAFNQLQASYGNSYAGQVIQRKCECGDTCEKCAGKNRDVEKKLQRKPHGSGPVEVPAGVASMIQASGNGSALPPATRSLMESRFGEDFGDVRLHTDSGAGEAARGLGAQAFTTGRDIFFGPGLAPGETTEGQRLLAHELTHVVQQRNGAVAPGSAKPKLDTPGDAFEREADANAQAIADGRSVRVGSAGSSPSLQRAGCPVFSIPGEKGDAPEVEDRYKEQLGGAGLRVRDDARQTSTDTLRRRWLDKKGHGGELQQLKDDKVFPKDNEGRPCTIDHIVEWVLHGGNKKDSERSANMMLMAGRRNKGAGGRVLGQINNLSGNCKSFSAYESKSKDPADECMLIDRNFEQWLKTKHLGLTGEGKLIIIRFKKADIPLNLNDATEGKGPKDSTTYSFDTKTLMRARKQKKGEETKAIVFDSIYLQVKDDVLEAGTIQARISDTIAFPFKGPVTNVELLITPPDNKVDLPDTKYKAAFPGLSETTFNFKTNAEGAVEGEAHLTPSKPILNKTVVHLIVKDDMLSAKLQVPVKDLSLPVPGLTLGGDGLILGFEDRQFFASGQVTLQYGNVAQGELTASATKEGFSAAGKIELTIPGIDKATGKIWIGTDGTVGGSIEVGADKIKVPGVKRANLKVTIQDGALSGEGVVQLAIPGVKQGKLSFGVDKNGNYTITGLATLDIPGVKSAEIGLTYREGDLEGVGKVGLDIPGLEGAGAAFEIRYARGIVTGAGDFAYQKGKISGKVHAELTEKRKLTGNGELAYEVTPGLVAALGVELREDGTTKFSPELRFPDTIDLFKVHPIEKTLFSVGTQIPIFAIPLGPRSVGLVAEVGADLKARAGIGPGQIRKLKVKPTFDSAKPEAPFEFEGGGELYVPAFAELALSVHGGIGLSLAIASATGGIKVTGAVGLLGALSVPVEIVYKDNQFSVDGFAELSAQPVMKFSVSAYVSVEVDLLFTSIEVYSNEWNLASKEWGGGLKIGLRFPVHYVFGQPFNLSLSQVEFIAPDIDVIKAVKDLIFD